MDQVIKEIFTVELQDKRLEKCLQLTPDLRLEKSLEMVQSCEQVRTQTKTSKQLCLLNRNKKREKETET